MSSVLGDEENTVARPTTARKSPNPEISPNLQRGLDQAAKDDKSIEGSSPPPSRPTPLRQSSLKKKKREQTSAERYSATENNNNEGGGSLKEELQQHRVNNNNNTSSNQQQKKQSRRASTQSKSGWDNSETSSTNNEHKKSIMQPIANIANAVRNSKSRIDKDHIEHDINDESDKDSIGNPNEAYGSSDLGAGSRVRTIGESIEKVSEIPDLQVETGEFDVNQTVAQPPTHKFSKIKTMRQLDQDLASSFSATLSNKNMIVGIDYSILSAIALCPPEQCQIEQDIYWDPDVLFAEVSTEFGERVENVGNAKGDSTFSLSNSSNAVA